MDQMLSPNKIVSQLLVVFNMGVLGNLDHLHWQGLNYLRRGTY